VRGELVRLDAVDATLRSAWAELAGVAAEPNPFHAPGLLLPAGKLLEGGAEVELLTVREGDRLEFLMPLRRVPSYRHLPLPAVMWWRHAYAFLSTPLMRPSADADVWTVALDTLRAAHAGEWLPIELMHLDGPVATALREALARERCRATEFEPYPRAVLHRRAEATYLDGRLSARHHKTLRRQRRRLAELLGGELGVVNCTDDRSIESFLAMEANGWKGRAGTAITSDPNHAEWFRRTARAFRDGGALELWQLSAGKRVAAYSCHFRAGDTVFHVKVAYDEELAAYSPGLMLELEMVERFHDDRSLQLLESCTAPGTHVSEQLYPDRRRIGTLLVPLGGIRARAAARLTPVLARGYRALKQRRQG
jgi:CelD/BcsL family acetyltransferase involved in cellulose biosynthesis